MTALGLALHRITTAQQVADGLSTRILAGKYGPGERLRESAIATELGISRNTVREAVRILELGGLVRHEVNRGAVVISPTRESVAALYVARDRLESAAAARTPSLEHLERLSDALTALREVAVSRDARQIVPVDLQFHAAIVAMLDSQRLDDFFADLAKELRFYLMVLSVEDREEENPDLIVEEHRAIYEAVASGDPTRAGRAVSEHIAVNATRVQDIVAKSFE